MFNLAWALLAPLISLAEPTVVTIRGGTDLYSAPNLVTDESARAFVPWNKWRQHCTSREDARGEILTNEDGVASVRLLERPDGCRKTFRAFDARPEIVFVDPSALSPDDGSADTAAGYCVNCNPESQPNALRAIPEDASILKLMAKNVDARKSEQKSDAELEAYLACYATEHQANYNTYYRKLFDRAARTFQVTLDPGGGEPRPLNKPEDALGKNGAPAPFLIRPDPSAMKCTGLRESRWDPTDPSPSGAIGIGQQTSINAREMKCYLEGCVKDGKAQSARPWAQKVWRRYFEDAKRDFTKAEYAKLTTHPITGKACSQTLTDVQRAAPCALNSIAAMALYQVIADLAIRRNDTTFDGDDTNDFGEKDAFHKTLVTANTNNAGVGTTAKAVLKGGSPREWLRASGTFSKDADRNKEIRSNSEVLGRCLKRGDFRPPWIQKPGEKTKDCSAFRKAAGI